MFDQRTFPQVVIEGSEQNSTWSLLLHVEGELIQLLDSLWQYKVVVSRSKENRGDLITDFPSAERILPHIRTLRKTFINNTYFSPTRSAQVCTLAALDSRCINQSSFSQRVGLYQRLSLPLNHMMLLNQYGLDKQKMNKDVYSLSIPFTPSLVLWSAIKHMLLRPWNHVPNISFWA